MLFEIAEGLEWHKVSERRNLPHISRYYPHILEMERVFRT